jgi:dephospho-CoA kinase
MNKNKQIIITGNIGTGKSTVTKIFDEQGYKIISADEISAKILRENHKEISKMFSMPPQKFDTFKKRLSNMVFGKQDKFPYNFKEQLEDFMLPKIQEEIEHRKFALSMAEEKYVIEMPTYFETRGLKKDLESFIIMVRADKDLRLKRIMERNKHLSIQDVLDRMKSQIDPSEKVQYCDEIIWNNTDIESLRKETLRVIEIINNENSYPMEKQHETSK